MRYLRGIFIIIIITNCLLFCACSYMGSPNKTSMAVNNALDNLLRCDNYTVEWLDEGSMLFEGEIVDFVSSYKSFVFHLPYRAKMISSSDSNEKEIVLTTGYQIEKEGRVFETLIYEKKDGSFEEFDNDSGRSDEWFLIQLMNNLVSEEYIQEKITNETNIKKYKISVRAYPFVMFLGIPYDKNDKLTRIFIDEYKTCEGYVYINSNDEIQKIEFDLSNKLALNEKINERYNTETAYPFTFDQIGDYKNMKISITISHVNDNGSDILETQKEIDEKMR